jgi:hypothetical protein
MESKRNTEYNLHTHAAIPIPANLNDGFETFHSASGEQIFAKEHQVNPGAGAVMPKTKKLHISYWRRLPPSLRH